MSISCVPCPAHRVHVSVNHLGALRTFFQLLADWLNEPDRAIVKRFQSLRLQWRVEAAIPTEAKDTLFLLDSLSSPEEDIQLWVRPNTQEPLVSFHVRFLGSKRLKNRDKLRELIEAFFAAGIVGNALHPAVPPPHPSEQTLISGSTVVPRIPAPRLPRGVELEPEALARILYTHFVGNDFSGEELQPRVVRTAGASSRATLVERLKGPRLAPYIEHHDDGDALRFTWRPTAHDSLFPEAASSRTKTTAAPPRRLS